MRLLRKILDIGLPLTGVVVILSTVLFIQEIRLQIAIVLIGIIFIEAGVWKLAHQLLPNDRQYNHLRNEIDNFVSLCRQLNSTAIALKSNDSSQNQESFDLLRNELQVSLDRICRGSWENRE